jgi:hypothetical protein
MLSVAEVKNVLNEIYSRLSFLYKKGFIKHFSSELIMDKINSDDLVFYVKEIFLKPYERKIFEDETLTQKEKLEILEEYSYVFSEIDKVIKDFLRLKEQVEKEKESIGLSVAKRFAEKNFEAHNVTYRKERQ